MLRDTAMLTVGRDYLFFEKVDCTKQSLTATMTRGAAVMTPSLIAMIPEQSFGSVLVATISTRYGSEPLSAVKAMLADPAMDVPALEAGLRAMFGGTDTRWIFPIAELKTFKVTTGFFGMISLVMPGESVRRIVIRDKGGKVAAKSFFAAS